MKFEGIYTPIVTPFGDDGEIDWNAYADVIDWQIENGVAGIIVGGSTGEFYALSKEAVSYNPLTLPTNREV